ncbi:10627_t:CDS:2 [Ambispora leptoticha]|uniref:10627_t:CDS:1 n=1 Tax=Ambispora leptoticha TaxID=144679 RepID=A0A9N8VKD8_9GLOM|nr:10627_t:CDS:2 [Ambispora leptoticha]
MHVIFHHKPKFSRISLNGLNKVTETSLLTREKFSVSLRSSCSFIRNNLKYHRHYHQSRHFNGNRLGTYKESRKHLKSSIDKIIKEHDGVIYRAPQGTNRIMIFWHVAGILQLIFWQVLISKLNIADLYWRISNTDKDNKTEANEKTDALVLPPAAAATHTPTYKRVLIVGGMLLMGAGISALTFIIPNRSIMCIRILKNGNEAQLETGRKFSSKRIRNFQIDDLTTRELLLPETRVRPEVGKGGGKHLPNYRDDDGSKNKNYLQPIFMRAKGERMGFMLSRSGHFEDPKLFDSLFYE